MHIVYYISLLLVRLTAIIYSQTKVIGKEYIPKKGGYILACNHLSNVDPFIMGMTTWRYLNFMAKQELFKGKLLSWYWHQVGAFPIKRGAPDHRSIREAIHRMEMGRLLVMFPEGTRGATGKSKKVNPGIGLLVKSANVPVVPVRLQGTDGMLPPKSKWFKFHPVTIQLGKPLHFSNNQSNQKIAQHIMGEIYRLG